MKVSKVVDFINKILTDTKSEKIQWKRCVRAGYDESKSFEAKIESFFVALLYDDDGLTSDVSMQVEYDPALPIVQFDGEVSPDVESALVRLHNYVYSLFPNIENVIDKYLSEW